MLSPNIVLPYDSTNASIPTGFTRVTALDGRFPKGWSASVAPGTQGGADTHTHTSAAHNHVASFHNHTVVTKAKAANPDGIGRSDGQGYTGMMWYHYHTGATNAQTSSTPETPTWGSTSNNPPYYELIFIQANSYQLIPKYGIVYRSGITRPGLSIHSPSLGKYHRGASTGANAGGTGGSFTNTHSISHTHNAVHAHTGMTSSTEGDRRQSAGSTGSAPPPEHQHAINLDNATTVLNANTPASVTVNSELSTDIEPAHRTLNAFYSVTSSAVPIKDDIFMWLGSPSALPLGWKLCDGTNGTVDMRDKFCKVPSTAPSASTTGGRNTHAHLGVSHSHTNSTSHTHTGSDGYNGDGNPVGVGNEGYRQYPGHTHDGFSSISTGTVTYGIATFTPIASDNQPLYTTVAYVQFIYSTIGGSFLFTLL